MLIIITYDVATNSSLGKKRLSKIAKECQNYARRVQNSVFECEIDYATWRKVKAILLKIVNEAEDSIRFYYLGDKFQNRVEHYRKNKSLYSTEPIII